MLQQALALRRLLTKIFIMQSAQWFRNSPAASHLVKRLPDTLQQVTAFASPMHEPSSSPAGRCGCNCPSLSHPTLMFLPRGTWARLPLPAFETACRDHTHLYLQAECACA